MCVHIFVCACASKPVFIYANVCVCRPMFACVIEYLHVSTCMCVCVHVCVTRVLEFPGGHATPHRIAPFPGPQAYQAEARTLAHTTAALLGYLFITHHIPQMVGGGDLD